MIHAAISTSYRASFSGYLPEALVFKIANFLHDFRLMRNANFSMIA